MVVLGWGWKEESDQHVFIRGKSCLLNLISFYDRVTHLADLGKPIDVIFLDFSQDFDAVSHSILLDQMSSIQLNNHVMALVNNWLMGQTQRVTVSEVTSGWSLDSSGIPRPNSLPHAP